nr:hypothetical protein [Tanacetum cinerariifolium]
MEYLVKISKKACILKLKRRHVKITVLTSNTPYPLRKTRRIYACTSQKTTKKTRSICLVNEEGVGADQGDHVDAGIFRVEDEVPTTIAEKAKEPMKKRKIIEATVLFVTSSVTLSPEGVGGGHTDSVSGPNLRIQHPAERFVISSDSSHHSSTNAADVEVTSLVRSPVQPPHVMTAAIATTAIASATSVLVLGARTKPVNHNLFRDSASPSTVGADVVGPSQPADAEDAEAAEAIHLCGQIAIVEATEAARVSELDCLKERTMVLEGQVATLESAIVIKDTELASSNVKVLSDRVAGLDSELIGMALHLDEEIYPCYLTTIARQRIEILTTMVTTTALSTTFIQISSVPPIPVANYEVSGAEQPAEVPSCWEI